MTTWMRTSYQIMPRPRSEGSGRPAMPRPQPRSIAGEREHELWSEVLVRGIEDFKMHLRHRADPERYPLPTKVARNLCADGGDPEYWIFGGDRTGFDTVCEVLGVDADRVREVLTAWARETLGEEPGDPSVAAPGGDRAAA